MCHYATLYAHAKHFAVQPVIAQSMRNVLTRHFHNLSIPAYSMNCSWNWAQVHYTKLGKLSSDYFEKKNVMIYQWAFDIGTFMHYQQDLISKEFSFDLELRIEAKQFLKNISQNSNEENRTTIFVSIHARRTDFKDWMTKLGHGGFVASQKFYLIAMKIYRNKYNSPSSKIVFIMASDDDQWCRKMFGNVSDIVFASSSTSLFSKQQPTFDLAIMSQCNHSIMR